ncbi:hypothetical protein [Clostridium sp. DL1XJH146]
MEMYDTKIGIVASGGSYSCDKEVFGEKASYMKIGFSWPMPMEKIKEFASKVDKIYVIEENDPIMENELKANGIECYGKDVFPSNRRRKYKAQLIYNVDFLTKEGNRHYL